MLHGRRARWPPNSNSDSIHQLRRARFPAKNLNHGGNFGPLCRAVRGLLIGTWQTRCDYRKFMQANILRRTWKRPAAVNTAMGPVRRAPTGVKLGGGLS